MAELTDEEADQVIARRNELLRIEKEEGQQCDNRGSPFEGKAVNPGISSEGYQKREARIPTCSSPCTPVELILACRPPDGCLAVG